MESENNLDKVEGQLEGLNFATEILKQLKETIKRQWIIIVILIVVLFASNMAWLYVYQLYDYSSSYEYSATGVNAIIDNSGNVVAQDIPDNQLQQILEILNDGESESENNQN